MDFFTFSRSRRGSGTRVSFARKACSMRPCERARGCSFTRCVRSSWFAIRGTCFVDDGILEAIVGRRHGFVALVIPQLRQVAGEARPDVLVIRYEDLIRAPTRPCEPVDIPQPGSAKSADWAERRIPASHRTSISPELRWPLARDSRRSRSKFATSNSRTFCANSITHEAISPHGRGLKPTPLIHLFRNGCPAANAGSFRHDFVSPVV